MATVWEQLALLANKDAGTVEVEAAAAWVLRQLADIDGEIAEYARRYATPSPEGLEGLIRDGKVEGHPAWEDRLDWSNLLFYRERLLAAIAETPRSQESDAP